MIIYNKQGNKLLDIEVNDNSYRYRSIMGENSITLYYSLTEHVEIPVGSYIQYQGEEYTLYKPENFSKKGTREYEYTVIFDSSQELLKRYKYKLISPDPFNSNLNTFELKFSMTARPQEFLKLMVDNLNLYDAGWTIGNYIESTEKLVSFNHDYCYDVLNRLATEFNTEWEIENKVIHLRKVEKFKDNPLPLSYGKGNGFKTGVGRQTQGDKPPVTLLYVQGGERNIDYTKYKSKTLLLPKSKELPYEERSYKTDKDGIYISRADRELVDINEDSLDATHIYPKWIGTVDDFLGIDEEVGVCEFTVKDPHLNPDFRHFRLPGEKATIIFQSGPLTGREFELVQTEEEVTGYIHEEGRFRILTMETDGTTLPNEPLRMYPGNTFAIFNIAMPDEYICDNTNETGASWDMFREAVRYMYEHEEEQFSFTGELDGIWAKKQWTNIGAKIKPGSYVLFSDTHFQPEGILIRMTAVKNYLNNPYSPEIELSNISVGGFVSSDLGKIGGNEVTNENQHKNDRQFTKRTWEGAKETLSLLEKAIDGFGEAINPVVIQTMAMLVGDERLQFRFVKSLTNHESTEPEYEVNDNEQTFTIQPGFVQHMTLGIGDLSSGNSIERTYKFWRITEPGIFAPKGERSYFLYLQCSTEDNDTVGTASYLLSEEAMPLGNKSGDYYYLLVGILSSMIDGKREFVTVYGFTEILPGRINVDRIVSPDGEQYWDFLKKQFKIGNKDTYLSYNTDDKGRLTLKGVLVQRQGTNTNDFSELPYFMGEWNAGTQYFPGDEVTYNGSTYRCKVGNQGRNPTETAYWTVIALKGNDGAKGNDGKDGSAGATGDSPITIYCRAPQLPDVPITDIAPNATSSMVTPNYYYWHMYIESGLAVNKWDVYAATGTKSGVTGKMILQNGRYWSNPVKISSHGNDGLPASLPTLRQWKEGETYYRNDKIVDYIYFQTQEEKDSHKTGSWWRVKADYVEATAGKTPTGDRFEIISSYEALATNVLLANEANLAEFIFKDGVLVSQNYAEDQKGIYLDGKNGIIKANDVNIKGIINATGGVFSGYISTPFKDLKESDAFKSGDIYTVNTDLNLECGEYYDIQIILPTDPKYNGLMVNIYNNCFPPYTKSGLRATTTIKVEGGEGFGNIMNQPATIGATEPTSLYVIGGLLQFLGAPYYNSYGQRKTKWMVLNYRD